MAGFVKGDVVVLPFPFSDLSQAKRRPALVVAEAGGDELLLCQITSQEVRDRHAVSLNTADFQSGSLRKTSNIRPNRIFTADSEIILYCAGHVVPEKTASVVEELVAILRG
ncbi:MAG: type II toxin-antitoxin system PemK/MazF family toxin [Planctomycetes bacterium]|nr:type II toxin-antitoxin system PemK/MazF family toxin [Planctomycetota bacterium]MCG2685264.1 type II toxin-antitoxin system PemK/MazF family toxin [Planctomycetales bacterium]